jgi:XTP/dITP diphosphohydrolase
MNVLVVATRNRKKERELRDLLVGSGWEVRSLAEMPGTPEVVEDGNTFLENARKKAIEVSLATHFVTLADDSGLEVDALGGAPGVCSARYAALKGQPASDEANCQCVLREMQGIPDDNRMARFVCAAVIAEEGNVVFETVQTVDGMIAREPRGSGGFGYDPIFFYPPFGSTFGEVSLDQKHAVSHRSKALAAVCRFLRECRT